MNRFSVIIPTRDRPGYLREAVDSVLGQSFENFELIIVNDGTTKIAPFRDGRACVLDNGGRGAVPARNLGIRAATGDVIAFLDDDDRWIDVDHLHVADAAFGNGAEFCFANGIMQFPGDAKPRNFSQGANALSLEKDNTILISAVCYRRSLHRALGEFDETLPYYWDWDWYLRVARAGIGLQHMVRAAVDIRIHPQNMSGADNALAREENLTRFAKKHEIGPLKLKNHADFASS